MLNKDICELIEEGFHLHCGAHTGDVGYYAIFDRRADPAVGDYCWAMTLGEAVQKAYEQATQWRRLSRYRNN